MNFSLHTRTFCTRRESDKSICVMANFSAAIANVAPIRLSWARILAPCCVKSAMAAQLFRRIHSVNYSKPPCLVVMASFDESLYEFMFQTMHRNGHARSVRLQHRARLLTPSSPQSKKSSPNCKSSKHLLKTSNSANLF